MSKKSSFNNSAEHLKISPNREYGSYKNSFTVLKSISRFILNIFLLLSENLDNKNITRMNGKYTTENIIQLKINNSSIKTKTETFKNKVKTHSNPTDSSSKPNHKVFNNFIMSSFNNSKT